MAWTDQDILHEYNFMKDPSRRWDLLCVKAANDVVVCSLPAHMSKLAHPLSHLKTADCVNPVPLFNPWDIAGHASRETGLYFWRKFPTGEVAGDRGRALGLLQVNVDFHAHVDGLEKPEINLRIGTLTLAEFGDQLALRPNVDTEAEYWPKLIRSAYNAGVKGALEGLFEHEDSDWFCAPGGKKGSPPGDYGRDVLNRAAAFQPLFVGDGSYQVEG